MPDFKQIQYEFANLIRDPKSDSTLNIEERRLRVYQRLIFNTIAGFIDIGFPVLKSLYSESQWTRLKRQFVKVHHSEKPLFSQISEEFIAFLMSEYQQTDEDPVFLKELAHYEWLELDISLRTRLYSDVQPLDLEKDKLKLSNLAEVVSYPFPVHQISLEYQPTKASDTPTYLVVYRDENEKVKFLSITSITAYLLELIKTGTANHLESILLQLKSAIPQMSTEQLLAGTRQSLNQLASLGVLIKTK